MLFRSPLESLDEESDYTGFLSPGVSEDLRRMALRRLFHLPQFDIRDGLNDYDEDFRIFEPLGKIVTADMKYHAERQAAAPERKAVYLAGHRIHFYSTDVARPSDEKLRESNVTGETMKKLLCALALVGMLAVPGLVGAQTVVGPAAAFHDDVDFGIGGFVAIPVPSLDGNLSIVPSFMYFFPDGNFDY